MKDIEKLLENEEFRKEVYALAEKYEKKDVLSLTLEDILSRIHYANAATDGDSWNPTTKWFSYGLENEYIEEYCVEYDSPEKAIKAVHSLYKFHQLIRVRDFLRQGWVPDWGSDKRKYAVIWHGKRPQINFYTTFQVLWAFQDEKTAKRFRDIMKPQLEQFYEDYK
jgi:hypothetical protein